MVVEQQLKKDNRRGQYDACQHLYAEDDQLQRRSWNQNDRCGKECTNRIDAIKARSVLKGHVEAMFPSPGFTPRPGTGKRDNGCAKDCCIEKHQQDSVTNEDVSERKNRVGHFCWILVGEPMLVRDIAHDNHGSGDSDGERSSKKGGQPSPFHTAKAQSSVSDAPSVKEEHPRVVCVSRNTDHLDYQVSLDSPRLSPPSQP